jgi:hypothetical protein
MNSGTMNFLSRRTVFSTFMNRLGRRQQTIVSAFRKRCNVRCKPTVLLVCFSIPIRRLSVVPIATVQAQEHTRLFITPTFEKISSKPSRDP